MNLHYGDPHEAAALRSLHRLTVVPGRPRVGQAARRPPPPEPLVEAPDDPDEQARLDAIRDEQEADKETRC